MQKSERSGVPGTIMTLSRWNLGLLAVFVLAVLLRLALFAAWHTDDWRHFENGDYPLYTIGAQHVRAEGDFSNSLFLVRPPLFILVVAALDINNNAILIVNAVVGALIAPLTCLLARRLGLGERGALLAGLLIAIDPAGSVYSTFLGPEPWSNVLLLAAVVTLLAGMFAETNRRALGLSAVAGGFLALAALARPAPFLLWIVLGAWLLIVNRRRWAAIGVFVLVSASGVGLWIVHNAVVFDYATFSTIGTYTTTYYHAASVEHLATGHDMDTVYTDINRRVAARLGNPEADVDAAKRHDYLAASPAVADALNHVSLEIFTDYPLYSLATLPIGFVRMFGLVTNALHGTPLPVRLLELAWNGAFLAGALAGLWLALRQRMWLLFWCVLLLGGYFVAGTLIVKTSGLSPRERSMLSPFMATAAAYAFVTLWERIRQRQRTQQ